MMRSGRKHREDKEKFSQYKLILYSNLFGDSVFQKARGVQLDDHNASVPTLFHTVYPTILFFV